MAIDIQRTADRIKDGLIQDPDDQYTDDMLQPEDADELDAFCYYIARGVLEELTDHAELDGVALSGIEVTVDPNTGQGATDQDGPLSGGVQ